MKAALLAAPLLLVAQTATGQVFITEVLSDGATSENAEWVEIHNTGGAPVDISGWMLRDGPFANARLYAFPAGTVLAADQVIIVTRYADAFAAEASSEGYAVATADFELLSGSGTDDPNVPDMLGTGGNQLAMNNSGDTVELLDATMTRVDAVEFGIDSPDVPGSAAPDTGSGETVCRVNVTGDSSVDFTVCAPPTPGVGFAGVTPVPPIIANETRAPANLAYGATFTFSATVTDADGVFGAEVYFATATASTSGNADGDYVAVAATNTSLDNFAVSGTIDNLVTFPEPTGFAERYVRYWMFALDNNADGASSPANAVTTSDNGFYFWENVLPQNTVFGIDEARVQDSREIPLYEGHSVRIEGVALTNREAFQGGDTNFFIASQTGVDAIRVFDFDLIGANVQPGDVVRVTGKIGVYRGVRQIGQDERIGQPGVAGTEVEVQVIGTAQVPMVTTTIAALLANGEQNESQLVELSAVQLVPNPSNGDPVPATWAGNSTLYVSDGTGTLPVRVSSFVDLADAPTPGGMFDLRGIFTQFAPGGTGGYQLQPRGLADVIGGTPPLDGGVGDAGEDEDGGMMNPDTGMDGGVIPDTGTDAGGGQDTGVQPDAGQQVDSGQQVDAGSGADASSRRDSGFFGTDDRDRGCGCTAERSSDGTGGLFGLMFLGLGLVLRRRR